MGRITTSALGSTNSFHEIIGRAAEIARALGSQVAGPEHFLLGMLHAESWPIRVLAKRELLDPDAVEAAVMSIIDDPGYSPPPLLAPAPAPPTPRDSVVLMAALTAAAMGDSARSELHAFLAIMDKPDSVPARALAQVLAARNADLAAARAALLEARNETSVVPESAVVLPADQDFDNALRDAIVASKTGKPGMSVGITADQRVWIKLAHADTRTVVNAALASLGRPLP